jgi:hypothetical protein
MNKLLAFNQDELRKTFQQQKIEAAREAGPRRAAFDKTIEMGYQALKFLGNRPAVPGSGLSSLISLPTPFLVWEWPHPSGELLDSHIEPLKSWAMILVGVAAYASDSDSGGDSKEFSFIFFGQTTATSLRSPRCFPCFR